MPSPDREPAQDPDRALPPVQATASQYATPATNKQIADEVFLSVDAVKGHLRTLFERFELGDLPQNQKRLRLVELTMQQRPDHDPRPLDDLMADAPEGPTLAPGAEFAGYRIEGVLGKGGMGVVYRATKLALDRERALKVIAPALSNDVRFRERFKRESRMAAAIEHPNVIPVHDAGEENGMLFLAMRLVEGSDLHRVVHAERRLGPSADRLDHRRRRRGARCGARGGPRPSRREAGQRVGRAIRRRRARLPDRLRDHPDDERRRDPHRAPASSSAASSTSRPSRPPASRSMPAPTSTRSAASPISCSPGGRPSRARTRWRRCSPTRTLPARGRPRPIRTCPRRSTQ